MIYFNLKHSNLFLYGICICLLNACSTTYRHQSSTESSSPTNPYKSKPLETNNGTEESIKVLPPNNTPVRPVKPEKTVVRKPLSPAVLALVAEADVHSKAGDIEAAVVTLERASRISPRNPILTYKMAVLRLHQSKPRLAEDLAKKAALLSGNDRNLKKQSWLLISKARKLRNNYYGAKEALNKANRF